MLKYNFSDRSVPVLNWSYINELRIPAGKQIKKPKKNIKRIVPFGSLNLSERVKNPKIIIDGTMVINKVLTS